MIIIADQELNAVIHILIWNFQDISMQKIPTGNIVSVLIKVQSAGMCHPNPIGKHTVEQDGRRRRGSGLLLDSPLY